MKKTIDVANVLLCNDLSEILLLQRSPKLKRGYYWGLPGGMVDENESSESAALRELYEETGVNEKDITIIGMMKFLIQMSDENVIITNIIARATIPDAEIVLDPNEHIAYKWMTETEIYSSRELVPGLPTMIRAAMNSQMTFEDLTLGRDTTITTL